MTGDQVGRHREGAPARLDLPGHHPCEVHPADRQAEGAFHIDEPPVAGVGVKEDPAALDPEPRRDLHGTFVRAGDPRELQGAAEAEVLRPGLLEVRPGEPSQDGGGRRVREDRRQDDLPARLAPDHHPAAGEDLDGLAAVEETHPRLQEAVFQIQLDRVGPRPRRQLPGADRGRELAPQVGPGFDQDDPPAGPGEGHRGGDRRESPPGDGHIGPRDHGDIRTGEAHAPLRGAPPARPRHQSDGGARRAPEELPSGPAVLHADPPFRTRDRPPWSSRSRPRRRRLPAEAGPIRPGRTGSASSSGRPGTP